MKNENLELDKIHAKALMLRAELEAQLNLLKDYTHDFELHEVTRFYYMSKRSEAKFIDFNSLKFNFNKYFIEVKKRYTFSSAKPILNTEIITKIKQLLATVFNNEDYVLVISNRMPNNESILVQLYNQLKTSEVGKLMPTERIHDLKEALVMGDTILLPNNTIKVAVNKVSYDVCIYEGSSLYNKNILLLGDEFGIEDSLTKLITECNPKSVINVLIGNDSDIRNAFLIDNID